MKKIQVRCPTCNGMGYIKVDDQEIQSNIRGVMGINIMKSVICDHAFVVYIDNNYELRDTFSTDFTINLPELQISEENGREDSINLEQINVNLITTNIFALTLAHILRACFYKRKILFLSDNEEINNHLNNFFNFCFQGSFEIFFGAKQRWEYNREKKKYKGYIIIENERIIKDKENFLNTKMIRIESVMVQKFLSESDSKTSIIKLKNEIKKVYQLSKHVREFIESSDNIENIKPKNVMKYIDQKSKQDINKYYLSLLIKILINYFNFKLKEKLDFFSLIHWGWYL